MKFSLVLATIGRSEECARFFASLSAQSYRHVQLIVVDQNEGDRVHRLLPALCDRVELIYLRTNRPGLSRARNLGLRHADGAVVGFPDDDCWYGPHLLSTVKAMLEAAPEWAGVTGRAVDQQGRTSCGVFAKTSGRVTMSDVWVKSTSYTIFLRREMCEQVGAFDESLGVGAPTPFGAAEEMDYLIRALRLGASIWYSPDLTVFHPDKVASGDPAAWDRAAKYGAGMGRVLAKHSYSHAFRLRCLARPLIGSVVAACQLQFGLSRMRLSTLEGRYRGMTSGFPRAAVTATAVGAETPVKRVVRVPGGRSRS